MPRSLKYMSLAAAIVLGSLATPAVGQPPGGAAPVTYELPLSDQPSSPLQDKQHLHAADQRPANHSNSQPLLLRQPDKASDATANPSRGRGSLFTVFGSLSVVLVLFFAVAWLMKRGLPHQTGQLPQTSFEVLGRASLASRQEVQLMRLGSKLLLIAVSANGAQTLAEIDDAAEIEELVRQCRTSRSHASRETNRRRWPFTGKQFYSHDSSTVVGEYGEANTTHPEAHHA